eukprot:g854.t1
MEDHDASTQSATPRRRTPIRLQLDSTRIESGADRTGQITTILKHKTVLQRLCLGCLLLLAVMGFAIILMTILNRSADELTASGDSQKGTRSVLPKAPVRGSAREKTSYDDLANLKTDKKAGSMG